MRLSVKLVGFAAIVAALSACGRGEGAAHTTLSSVTPLRDAFNADSGKVRAIFLASPT